jgi:hypothetical protein
MREEHAFRSAITGGRLIRRTFCNNRTIELHVSGGRVLWYTINVRYGIVLCNNVITNNMYRTVPCRTVIEKYKFATVPYSIVSHRIDNGIIFKYDFINIII